MPAILRSAVAICLSFVAGLAASGEAEAHPHVFVEARMEIVGDAASKLVSVRNIWRMDELFSTSVVLDFDKNANSVLDDDELAAVGETVRTSIAEWDFYTFVRVGGQPVKMVAPDEIRTLYENGQLLLFFEMKAQTPIDMKIQTVSLSNFDETFFVAFTYEETDAFQLVDLPSTCTQGVTVPDEDEAAAQWMASIANLGPDEEVPDDGVDYSQLLATRVEVKCG
ncbi:MAG: DUF1007 family protein [Rhizobiaceae bacterium]|nr:DUF1007 family protein [Rhizobiaceae bacterium]